MKCADIQELLLTDYLDGQVSPEVKSKVDAHLVECLACREFFAAVCKVNEPFEKMPSVEPPACLWERVRARIEPEPFLPFDGIQVWWEEVISGFRPDFVRGSLAAGMLALLFFLLPMAFNQTMGLAGLDRSEIMELAFWDETSGSIAEIDAGYGSAAEHLL